MMNSANDTTPSPKRTDDLQSRLEFRRIPIEKLSFPQALFDARASDPCGKPQLLAPLIVYQSGTTCTVIDGCKRLLHARQTGAAACDCGVLTPAPDERHAALLRFSLNRGRTLHFIEKLLFVRWLKDHCDAEQYRQECGRLSLDNRERFEFEQLAACSASVADAAATGALERSLAPDADRLDPPDRETVLALFRRYPFSRQMQRELLDWLPELAFREKCTLTDLLASPWLQEIERGSKLNGPQKIDHVRSALFNRRFPTLARAKAAWNEHAAKLNPDSQRVAFKPAEAFEKNRLDMKISITSADQAKHIFSRLAEITPEEWDRLIYPAPMYACNNGRS